MFRACAILVTLILSAPSPSEGEQPTAIPRLGMLRTGSPSDRVEDIEAFRKGFERR